MTQQVPGGYRPYVHLAARFRKPCSHDFVVERTGGFFKLALQLFHGFAEFRVLQPLRLQGFLAARLPRRCAAAWRNHWRDAARVVKRDVKVF